MTQASETFEDGMARLQEIVKHLEAGDVPLEETIKLFREGIDIRDRCGALLQRADDEIRELMTRVDGNAQSPSGQHATSEPVDPDELPFE